MQGTPSGSARTGTGRPLSVVLFDLAHEGSHDRIYLRDMLRTLGDRAHGALMFVLAVPSVMPVPPGVSTILGLPLMVLALQMLFRQPPWLPEVVGGRSLDRSDFVALTRRVIPWLQKAERLLRPRWLPLTRPPVENLLGLLCLVLAIVLALPIPLGNTLPALAISILALGILERDGMWISAGILAAAGALAVVSGVVFAMVKGVLFMLGQWWA